jgi:DHA1 family bicyclomycin/chloramphenicol resistance-like MFS transporter
VARAGRPVSDEARSPDGAGSGRGAGSPALLVLILGGLSSFGPFATDMYLPALPAMARDFATPEWTVQLTLTGCLAGLAAGQLVAGPLSDRLGRRLPLLLGVSGFVIASGLCVVAPSISVLIVLRVLQGLTGAAGIVIARAIVRDLHAGVRAARLFSTITAVMAIGPIVAPVIGALVLRVTSWRGVFVVLAGLGLALLLAVALRLPETLPGEGRRQGGFTDALGSYRRLARSRWFLGHVLAMSLGFSAMFAYISGSSFVLQEAYGFSPQAFSAVFATNGLGIAVASQINGRLVGRVPLRRLLVGGLIATCTGGLGVLAAVVTGVGLPGIVPALFVVVASLGFVLPNATTLALADHPDIAGAASGVLGAVQLAFGAAVAPIVGLGGHAALPMAVTIAALGVAALAILGVLAGPGEARRRQPPAGASAAG